ncbi:MAG TPA: ABC transporter ATP-binding protein [Phycisphaerae bacterium]|nr:ABC transporter ATP-binding protein [Phycisphaerae bacterium]
MNNAPREDNLSPSPIIEVDRLSFSYGGSVPVLEDVSLSIGERDFVCVVGPNGGGKTTLLKLLLGLLKPDAGTVRVFGKEPERARPRVGYLAQRERFDAQFPVTVLDVVLMGRVGKAAMWGPYRKADKEAAARALHDVGMYNLRYRSFSSLSGGQSQRVLIARALSSEPKLLLLDEPTAHLDAGVQDDFYRLLYQMNERLTLVMVSHDIGFVSKYVKTVVCVSRRVILHPTNEITGEVISEIYGRDMHMVMHHRGDHE